MSILRERFESLDRKIAAMMYNGKGNLDDLEMLSWDIQGLQKFIDSYNQSQSKELADFVEARKKVLEDAWDNFEQRPDLRIGIEMGIVNLRIVSEHISMLAEASSNKTTEEQKFDTVWGILTEPELHAIQDALFEDDEE